MRPSVYHPSIFTRSSLARPKPTRKVILEDSFLSHRHYFWLKCTLTVFLACLLAYVVSASQEGPYGGSVIGLSYGVLGFVVILILLYYGVRKRSYWSAAGTLQDWLSSHVYLGVLSLLLILFHAGFELGLNIHSFAFLLLFLVIGSGMTGVYFYLTIPAQFSLAGREIIAQGQDSIDQELARVIRQMRALSESKSPSLRQICEEEVQRGRPRSFAGWRLLLHKPLPPSSTSTLQEFQNYLRSIPIEEREALRELATLATRKREIEYRRLTQMRLRNTLDAWLYIHVPLSMALLAAVLVHIVTVFYY